MSRTIVLGFVVLFSTGIQLNAQTDWETLSRFGVTAFDISDESRGRVRIEEPNSDPDKVLVNLFDARRLRWSLVQLGMSDSSFSLVIGNSTANFALDECLEDLLNIPRLDLVVLDSVDYSDSAILQLKERFHGVEIILSQRSAIRNIETSYNFAQSSDSQSSGSLSLLERNRPEPAWYVDDEHFLYASRFKGIKSYPIHNAPIPEDAVRFFRHLVDIREVELMRVALSDEHLSYFSKLKSLEYLGLSETEISGVGLQDVACESLRVIHLSSTPNLITVPFRRLTALEEIDLYGSKIRFSELSELKNCNRLKIVCASEDRVRVADITQLLEALPDLELLEIEVLEESAREPEEIDAIRARFPGVDIYVDHRDENIEGDSSRKST